MGAGRYDQRPDDQLLDVRKYFLGDRLDMFGIERQPFGSDLRHGFSLVFLAAANGSFTTAGPRSRSKKAAGLICGQSPQRSVTKEKENRCYAPSRPPPPCSACR